MDWIQYIILTITAINLICIAAFFLNIKKKLEKSQENEKDGDKELQMQHIINASETNLRESIFRLNKELNADMSNFKDKITENMSDNFNKLNATTESRLTSVTADLNLFKDKISGGLSQDIEKLNNTTETRLLTIESKVNERLEKGFKETNEAFVKMSNSLARIDEAQKHIDSLNKEVVSLQEILGDKKSRGNYGEIQLNTLLYSVFGENSGVYDIQHPLGDGSVKVDVLLKLPEPLGNISVDSKFPLENYKRMIDKSVSQSESEDAARAFRNDVKKHINDISSKYIIPNETSSHAIMFIPAEAVFSQIHAYHHDILEYANEKNIWIVSPTTFMALLTTVQVVLRNIKRDEYAQEIYRELNVLGKNFRLYGERWTKLSKNIETVYKDVKDVSITTNRIKKHFDAISSADITTIENLKNSEILIENIENIDDFEKSENEINLLSE
ncbi:MAG: DNA recombination protein RmuC [Oscillospiraceae bacterium]|nr:DNA recombination protein RmuC [Oscillospiraceae bacterium]